MNRSESDVLSFESALMWRLCCIHILCTPSGSRASSGMCGAPRRFLTGSIEQVSEKFGVGRQFLGLIVLPIAGNACEVS